MSFRAYVHRAQNWDAVILELSEYTRPGHSSILMKDGTWQEVPELQIISGDTGFWMPKDSFKVVAQAFEEFNGPVSNYHTESKVLREWLSSERNRIDIMINKILQ